MIILSANNYEEMLVLPIQPTNIPITNEFNHGSFETFGHGELTLLNKVRKPRTVTISSWLPKYAGKYPYQEKKSVDAEKYLAFINKWTDVPIRVYISEKDGSEYLNMPCTVTSFNYHKDKTGDIVYNLALKEFLFVGE